MSFLQTVYERLHSAHYLVAPIFLVLAFLGGVVYPLLFLCVTAQKRLKARRAQRQTIERKNRYILPDRDNEFVKMRLNTVLRTVKEEDEQTEENLEEKSVRLDYARRLLNALCNEPLGTVERLEMTELSALLALYLKKDKWNATELKRLNDVFARILKLAGKYAPSVN